MDGTGFTELNHHIAMSFQPDEFWDAIYTSKDPDLPTPPGAEVSEEATVKPIQGPEISMRRLATMVTCSCSLCV